MDIEAKLRKLQTQLSLAHAEVTDILGHIHSGGVTAFDTTPPPEGGGPGEGPDGHP